MDVIKLEKLENKINSYLIEDDFDNDNGLKNIEEAIKLVFKEYDKLHVLVSGGNLSDKNLYNHIIEYERKKNFLVFVSSIDEEFFKTIDILLENKNDISILKLKNSFHLKDIIKRYFKFSIKLMFSSNSFYLKWKDFSDNIIFYTSNVGGTVIYTEKELDC
ncbi:hypothetical protein [Algibacter sp. 2305UL17-15]|uniref:hypothetical protein n=1 Tax=Algibacter sp. 2305UL17-15 TaxID=3231268 RepID=UPI003459B8BE